MIDEHTLNELASQIGKNSLSSILKVFLEEMGAQLVEIKSCIKQSQIKSITPIAHTLKSTSATFGAVHVNECAQRLENASRQNKTSIIPALVEELEIRIEETIPLFRPYTE